MSKRFVFFAILIGLAVALSGQDAMVKEISGSVETRLSDEAWTPVEVGSLLPPIPPFLQGLGPRLFWKSVECL